MEFDTFVIDSSVFVAFYSANDTQHQNALRVLEEIAQNFLIVHPYVIQEVATVLAYRLGIATAKKFLNDITHATNVSIPYVDIEEDIAAFSSANKRISFTDTALIRLAKARNAKLITFDRQMLSLYAK